ncbi:MAG: hypothetical protein IT201_01255 [Thermoleophilia bacterium]|nr:hypothetical protein [Thermoleophilia bacterium]
MISRWKLAVGAAVKAKRAWDRIPPEQRAKALESAKAQVRTHGPTVAKAAAATAQKAAGAAATHGPVIARRIADAIEKSRKR